MFVHGMRGDQLPEEELSKELEVYGVDWKALHDEQLLRSQTANNSQGEGWTSWVGQTGPLQHLNEVSVEPPALWTHALGQARAMNAHLFLKNLIYIIPIPVHLMPITLYLFIAAL